MARQPTTKTTKPRKTAQPKKATDPQPRPAEAIHSAETEAEPEKGTAVIRFDKTKNRGRVRGAVNGQKFDFPTDTDVTVTAAQLNALRDSNREFTTVSPLAGEDADEGSSASSTVSGTAFRLETNDEQNPALGEDGSDQTRELRQITDKELTDGADQKASQEQADETAKDEDKADD